MDGIASKLLSFEELSQANNAKIEKPSFEPKKNFNSQDLNPESDSYLSGKYLELERVLNQPRILTKQSSHGEYVDGKVLITEKKGKWDRFGFTDQGKNYAHLYEALFMVEMRRLIVFRNGVVMSLEECYNTFLKSTTRNGDQDGDHRLTLAQYLVYALITRNGYFAMKNKPFVKVSMNPTETDFIWNNLKELLSTEKRQFVAPNPVPDRIKRRMEDNLRFIKSPAQSSSTEIVEQREEMEFEWPKNSLKRKRTSGLPTSSPQPVKRSKNNEMSSLDVLKTDPEYRQLMMCFEELNVIRISSQHIEDDFQSPFSFHLDILNPKSGYKRYIAPDYRGIVCNGSDTPSQKDLIYLQRKQCVPLPILVFHVDESMTINCFVYEVDR